MTAGVPDLVEFLTARLDEDEAAARALHLWIEAPRDRELPWKQTPSDQRVLAWGLTVVGATNTPELAAHIARHDPARVLAEVKAKRRLVERESTYVLQDLATIYAGHPDYQREWKP